MLSDIKFSYPTWFLLLCVLLGLAYAAALYLRDRRFDESPKWSRWAMALMRTLAVTGIATLLLSPLVRTTTEEIKQPIVVIAQDASQSVTAGLDAEVLTDARQQLTDLSDELAQTYDVRHITIADQVQEGTVDSFTANVTNLSAALQYIDDNYADQNLGAVIMATDGIYNEGKNPLYTRTELTSPLYIVAQGDTSVRRDLSIKNIFANKISYLGDKFTIQVDVAASNANASSSTLRVSKISETGTVKQHSEAIRINSDNYYTTKEIQISADQVGVNRYRVSLSPVSNEVSTANNYKDIYVEVLDARQKVLLLAHAPHPDLSALKSLISNNKNYEAEVKFVQDNDYVLAQYDMVVLHNLPSAKYDIASVKAELDRRRTPRLYIVGAQTEPILLNRQQEVVRVNATARSTEQVQVHMASNFNSFTISDKLTRTLRTFPPLVAPFGEYTDPLGANVLLQQSIKDIETDYPQLAFRDGAGYKTGVWVGEGIWKWRLFNFVQTENYDMVQELVNKAIQYLSTKEDKRKFRASSSKNLYKENEDVLFDAQLFNDNYELINTPDVFITIKNSEQKEYKYTMSRTNNYYSLNARLLAPGKYSYVATTNFDGKPYEQKGYFSVEDIQLELYDLTARHGLLRSLSNKYGGQVVLPTESSQLAALLTGDNKLKPVVYPTTRTKSVISFKWLFWLLLALLSLEWFLRRYMGNY